MRERKLKKIERAVNTVIVRLRVDKRFVMIKKVLKENKVTTREQAVHFVKRDWQKAAMYSGAPTQDAPFQCTINPLAVPTFPEEFEAHMEGFSTPFEVSSRFSYNQFAPVPLTEVQEFELTKCCLLYTSPSPRDS